MDTLKLEVDYAMQAKAFTVNYKVENKGPGPVWLVNVLWDYDPTGHITRPPQRAYVSVEENGALKLGQFPHPLPENMEVELRNVPMARLLDSMGSYSETLEFKLPLREYNPYYDDAEEPDDEEELETRSAQFWLAWLPATDDIVTRGGPVDGGKVLSCQNLIGRIRTLRTTPFPLKVQALRRVDDIFERF